MKKQELYQNLPPILGFSAFSGTGKTTLLIKLIPLFKKQGLTVSVLKHSHHPFEIDVPTKDSFQLRKAGAYQMLISCGTRKALVTEFTADQQEPTLDDLIAELDHNKVDLILVEGFKWEKINKIELHREALAKPYLHLEDKNIVAIASDHPISTSTKLPILDLNDVKMIADFIITYTGIKQL